MIRLKGYLLALAMLLVVGPIATARATEGGAVPDLIAAAVAERLAGDGPLVIDGETLDLDSLRGFYTQRDYAPAWESREPAGVPGADSGAALSAATLSAAGRELRAVLQAADAEGLSPGDYHPAAVEARIGAADLDRRVDLDLLLTDALMAYAVDLRTGRLAPRSINRELYITPDPVDPVAAATAAVAAPDLRAFLASLAPPDPRYAGLRQALAQYRALERAGGWPAVTEGPKISPGARNPAVPAVRRRLMVTGELAEVPRPEPKPESRPPSKPKPESKPRDGLSDRLDPALQQAVARFQARHGLEPDGVIGTSTRAALAVPVADRIAQILANMERLRWLPDNLGERYVEVNIPAFRLKAVDHGQVAHDMPVIVGTVVRRTPQFSSRITSLTLNPTWTVPQKLAREDILPKLQKNPGYLASHGIQVMSSWAQDARPLSPNQIDWRSIGTAINRYRLRQMPGPLNALGQVKFNIPNQFDVYLHDTPHREKFGRTVRTFSSGCVRVGQPAVLADFLLADMPDWPAERRQQALGSGQTRTIMLRQPVPVHLLYMTAWVDDQGVVQFREDIYGRDTELLKALDRRAAPTQKVADARR